MARFGRSFPFGARPRTIKPKVVTPPNGPFLVATTDQQGALTGVDWGIAHQFQRGSFTAAGRDWIIYGDSFGDLYAYITTSVNSGVTWSSPTLLYDLGTTSSLTSIAYGDYHFDGTYFHYAIGGASTSTGNVIIYRRGLPLSDGTIAWSASDQVVFTGDGSLLELSLNTDSNGKPWVSWEYYNDSVTPYPYPMVNKATTADGTWTDDVANGFPYQLSTEQAQWWTGVTRLDNSGRMVVFYWNDDVYRIADATNHTTFARVWSGSAMGAEFTLDTPIRDGGPYGIISTIAFASNPATGIAYFAWLDDGGTTYCWVGNSSGTVGVETVMTDAATTLALGYDPVTSEVVLIYEVGTTLKMRRRNAGGTWSSASTIVSSAEAFRPSALQITERANRLMVTYQTNNGTARDPIYMVLPVGGTVSSVDGSATLNGVSSRTATANMVFAGAATLAGSSTVSATGYNEKRGSATLAGSSGLTATAILEKLGSATLAGSSTETATGLVERNAAATLAGTSGVSLTGFVDHRASATLAGSSGLTATGNEVYAAAATLNGISTLSATGDLAGSASGSATLNGVSTLSASATNNAQASATLAGLSGSSLTAIVEKQGSSSVSGSTGLTASARVERLASASLAALTALTATPIREVNGSVTATGPSTAVANGSIQLNAATTLNGLSGRSATAVIDALAAALLNANSGASITAGLTLHGSASLHGISTLYVVPPGNPVNGVAYLYGRSYTRPVAVITRAQATLHGTSGLSASGITADGVIRQHRQVFSGRSGVRGSRVSGGVR